MGDLTPEGIEKIRRIKERQAADPERALARTSVPGMLDIGGAGWRYLDRATRVAGLGIGTVVGGALNLLLDPYDSTFIGRWLPDIGDVPEAMRAFNRMRQQGDWDTAIGAYQDAFDAGPGFWGASEVAASFIPTGGPFLAGGKLLGVAPGLAKAFAKVAPQAIRPGVQAGIRGGVTGLGKTLRVPWQVEEAAGRLAFRGVGKVLGPVVGPVARPLVSRLRRPVAEAIGEAPPGAITPMEPPRLMPEAKDVGVRPPQELIDKHGFIPEGVPFQGMGVPRGGFVPVRGAENVSVYLDDAIMIDGRKMVIVRLDDGSYQPFYKRTGGGGLEPGGAQPGDWAPFDGVALKNSPERRGWFNKSVYTQWFDDSDRLIRWGTEENRRIGLALKEMEDAFAPAREFRNDSAVNRWLGVSDDYLEQGPGIGKGPTALPAPTPTAAGAGVGTMRGKRSSQAWSELYEREEGIKILDPDGWDRVNFEDSWGELISQTEFKKRMGLSTLQMRRPGAEAIERVPGGPPGRLAAAGEVPPGMPELQDIGEAINIATRSNLGRRLANLPVIRSIMTRVHPSAVRNTVEERGLTGLAILRFEAQKKASESMTSLGRLGTQERVFGKIDDRGLFAEGNLKGLAPNDVRTNWEQLHISRRLNDKQREWIRTAQELEEAKLAFLKNNGIAIKELTFESGGHYAGRRLMGRFDSDNNLIDWGYAPGKRIKGRKLPQENKRSFRTQKEAIDLGFRYIPEDEALSMNVRAAYNRVADNKFAEWLLANSPNIRVLGKGLKPRKMEVAAGLGKVIPGLRGVVFKGPEADKLAKLMRQDLAPVIGDFDKMLSAGAKVNAVGRFMMLNGDASPFLIQLLYMIGARGGHKAWGKGLYGFARTLGDTRYHKALIDNNRELLARHRGLITSLDGNEYTEAVARGGLLGRGPSFKTIVDPSASMRTRMAAIAWSPLRLTGKLLDPFGRAFSSAMDTAGIQLAKSMDAALKPKTAADIADIDAFINEIRGLHSSVRLGQSARWRSIENNLLLAPRYNRSIAALLWDTVADGGIRGHEARRALGWSLTGLTSIAVGFSILEYWRETEEKDQTESESGMLDAVMKHITPTSPEFFTWKVGNSNVGPGTKVRSLIKLFAQSYDDPRSLLEIGMENPFTRFARGNLAPIASDAVDIFSGYTYMGDPTGFFDGWDEDSVGEDFYKLGTKVILPDIMPIWVHAAALEGGTLEERGLRGAAEFAGGRAYPLKWGQRAEQIAEEEGYGEYETLSARRKAEVRKLVEEEFGKSYRYAEGPVHEKVDKADDEFLAAIQKITTSWLSMGPGGKGYRPPSAGTEYKKAQTDHMVKQYGTWDKEKQRYAGGYFEDLYDMDKEQEEPERGTVDHLLWRYRNLIPSVTDADGIIDWDEYDKVSSEFWSSLGLDDLDAVLDNIRIIEVNMPEEMQTFLDARRYAQAVRVDIDGRSVSFWDIEDLPEVRNTIARDARATRAQVDEYMDTEFNSRDYLEGDIYKEIGSALARARRTDTGVLGRKKWEFMNKASETSITWLLAMIAAGYYMPKRGDIITALRRRGEYSTVTEQPYASLYRDALARR